jgi:hypothetical protein
LAKNGQSYRQLLMEEQKIILRIDEIPYLNSREIVSLKVKQMNVLSKSRNLEK